MVKLTKNEKGFTLIEVLVALGILGIVAATFLIGLATSSKAIMIADEHTTAESLARSQMEFVKNLDYIPATGDGGEIMAVYGILTDIPDGYIICSKDRNDETVENTILGIPWNSQTNQKVGTDTGLQRIKLVIKHNGNVVLTLEDYKVDR